MSWFGLSFGSYVTSISVPEGEPAVAGQTIGEFLVDESGTYVTTRHDEYIFTNTLLSLVVDENDDQIVTAWSDSLTSYEIFENPETSDDPVIVGGGGGGGPSISATGLMFFIDGNGDVLDQSPNSLSVSNVNSAGFVAGPGAVNQAVDLQSSDSDYLNVSDDAAIDLTGDYTLFMWIYLDTTASDQGIMDKTNEWSLYNESSLSGYLRHRHTTTQYGNTGDNSNDLSTGAWQFLWVRFDATANTLEHSVDNASPTTTSGVTVDPTAGSSDLNIGRYFGTNYMDGALCMVGGFSRKLTDDELTDLYNSGAQLLYSEITWT